MVDHEMAYHENLTPLLRLRRKLLGLRHRGGERVFYKNVLGVSQGFQGNLIMGRSRGGKHHGVDLTGPEDLSPVRGEADLRVKKAQTIPSLAVLIAHHA